MKQCPTCCSVVDDNDRIAYDPINETLGEYTLYTDEDYRLFLSRSDSLVTYELFGGGESLRRVATDHRSTIAVLTSEMRSVEDIPMAKVYLYTLE